MLCAKYGIDLDVSSKNNKFNSQIRSSRNEFGRNGLRVYAVRCASAALLQTDKMNNCLHFFSLFPSLVIQQKWIKPQWREFTSLECSTFFQKEDYGFLHVSTNDEFGRSMTRKLARVAFLETSKDKSNETVLAVQDEWKVLRAMEPQNSKTPHMELTVLDKYESKQMRRVLQFPLANNLVDYQFIEICNPAFVHYGDSLSESEWIPIPYDGPPPESYLIIEHNKLLEKFFFQSTHNIYEKDVAGHKWPYLCIDGKFYRNLKRYVYSTSFSFGDMEYVAEMSMKSGFAEATYTCEYKRLSNTFQRYIFPFSAHNITMTKNIKKNEEILDSCVDIMGLGTEEAKNKLVHLSDHLYHTGVRKKELLFKDHNGKPLYGEAKRSSMNWKKVKTIFINPSHSLEKLMKVFSWNNFMVMYFNKERQYNKFHDIHSSEILFNFLNNNEGDQNIQLCEKIRSMFDHLERKPEILLQTCHLFLELQSRT